MTDGDRRLAAPALQLLGRPCLVDVEGRAHALGPLDAALLMLVLRRGPLPRDWLAERLWPDDEPEAARAKLRQHVFQLGRRAGRPLFVGAIDLALHPEVQHDLAPKRCDTTLDLLPGLELPDHPQLEAAVCDERRRWVAEGLDDRWAAVEREQSLGRWVEALRVAEQLVQALPVSERAARLQMTLHARLRDRSAVLLAFDRLKQRLHEQLGERPSAETVALVQAAAAELDAHTASSLDAASNRSAALTVGRAALVAQLLARLEQRKVAVITGMAGIGKTKVIDEVTSRLSAALVCRCEADDRGVPWGALSRLASVLLAAGAGALDVPTSEALKAVAQAGSTPSPRAPNAPPVLDAFDAALTTLRERWPRTVIVVDDLHFADDDSVKLIALLLDRGDRPGWLLATRPEMMPASLKAWLLAQPADDEAQHEVTPLTVADLAAWLHALGAARDTDVGAWAGALERHCGGHPLHTLQVLREVGIDTHDLPRQPPSELPVPRESLLRLARQLDVCAPETRRLAYVAAVGGGDFDFDLAHRMTGWSASQIASYWQPLQRLHLMRERHFTHELVRQAVLESLPVDLLAGIHVEIAEGLRERDAPPARRLRHWLAAQRWRDAAGDAQAAAVEAEAVGLRLAARGLLLESADAFERCGETARAFALRARVVGMTLALLSADQARDEAQALTRRAVGDAQAATAMLALSQVAAENGEAGALDAARQAQRLADAVGDPALQRLAGLRVVSALYAERGAEAAYASLVALRPHRDAMTGAERDEFDDVEASLLASLGQRKQAVALWLTALDRARAGTNPARVAEHAGNAAIHLGYLCRTEEALVLCEEAAEIDRRLQSTRGFSAVNLLSIAGLCLDTGRYGRALAIGEEGMRLLRESGVSRFTVSIEHVVASTYLCLGRPDLGALCLHELAEGAQAWVRAMRQAKRGVLAAAMGDVALPHFDAALACLDSAESVLAMPRWRILIERAAHARPEQALDDARRCAVWAAGAEYVALERHARMTELRALLALGSVEDAAGLADRLHDACAPDWQTYDFDRVDLWKAVIQAWDRVGRDADADRLAATAAAWIERCARDEVPARFVDSYLHMHDAVRRRAGRHR